MKNPNTNEVREKAGLEHLSVSKGVFTARRSFFYRHGVDSDKFSADVLSRVSAAFPGHEVKVVDHGEKWVAFNGGHTVAQGSHWWVKFTVTPKAAQAVEGATA